MWITLNLMQCFDVRSCYLWSVPIWCKCLCKHALSEKQQQKTHKNCHKFCWTIYMTVFQQTPAHIQLSFCSLRSLSFRHCIQEMKNCLKLLNRIFSEHLQTSIKNRLAFVNRMTYPRTAVVSSHNDLAYIILNLVWQWTKGMVKYSTFINCITWTFAVDNVCVSLMDWSSRDCISKLSTHPLTTHKHTFLSQCRKRTLHCLTCKSVLRNEINYTCGLL